MPHLNVPLCHGPHQSLRLSGQCSLVSCFEIILRPQPASELSRRALLWHQVSCEDSRRHLRSFEVRTGTKCCARTTEGTSEAFEVKTGVRQGCILSPLLFNCFLDRIVKDVLAVLGGGFHVE